MTVFLIGTCGSIIEESEQRHLEYANQNYRFKYQGDFAEKDEETGWHHFELRQFDSKIGRWLSVDPARQFASPYVGVGNNPINGVDPDGAFWDPDKNGNLVAEEGDNASTLAEFLDISIEEASGIFYDYSNWDGNALKGGLENIVGHTLTLDNVYTRSIIEAYADEDFDLSRNYNCWGATYCGIHERYFVNMGHASDFDKFLRAKFQNVTEQNMVFGKTAIRFAKIGGYDKKRFDEDVVQGTVSRNIHDIGGTSHAAVFYGKNKAGEIYVYTKNVPYNVK